MIRRIKKLAFGSWPMLVVGLPLIVSALIHFAGPFFFLEAILQYQLVRGVTGQILAMAIMVASLMLGTALIFFPRLARAASLLAFILYLSFLIAQVSAIVRGLNIACGCFGPTNHHVGWLSMGFTLSLAVIAGWMFWKGRDDLLEDHSLEVGANTQYDWDEG